MELASIITGSIAFCESLIMVIRIGMMIGNARIAIMVKLLFALDAMAEIIVKREEIPIEPSTIIKTKSDMFSTALPINKL